MSMIRRLWPFNRNNDVDPVDPSPTTLAETVDISLDLRDRAQ